MAIKKIEERIYPVNISKIRQKLFSFFSVLGLSILISSCQSLNKVKSNGESSDKIWQIELMTREGVRLVIEFDPKNIDLTSKAIGDSVDVKFTKIPERSRRAEWVNDIEIDYEGVDILDVKSVTYKGEEINYTGRPPVNNSDKMKQETKAAIKYLN